MRSKDLVLAIQRQHIVRLNNGSGYVLACSDRKVRFAVSSARLIARSHASERLQLVMKITGEKVSSRFAGIIFADGYKLGRI